MNQTIDLDFIQAPLFSLSRFVWLRLVTLAFGLAAVVIVWQTHQSKQAELAVLESKLQQLSQVKQIQPTVKQSTANLAPEKIKELQDTVDMLAIPWNALFVAIEHTRSNDVTLLSLEPNTKKQQVLIMGQAKNLQVALQYVAKLQKQPVLAEVFLQKHAVDESNVSKPVSFTVLAKWETVR